MTRVVMIPDYSGAEVAMRKPNHPADAPAEHPYEASYMSSFKNSVLAERWR
jgi:hypothetical protein